MSHQGQPCLRDDPLRSAQPGAVGLGSSQPSPNPLRDASPFEFRESREDVQLQPPCGRRAIYSLVERHEGHTQRVHLIEQGDEVPQASTQAVQTPADDHIDPPAADILHKGIQGPPAIL